MLLVLFHHQMQALPLVEDLALAQYLLPQFYNLDYYSIGLLQNPPKWKKQIGLDPAPLNLFLFLFEQLQYQRQEQLHQQSILEELIYLTRFYQQDNFVPFHSKSNLYFGICHSLQNLDKLHVIGLKVHS